MSWENVSSFPPMWIGKIGEEIDAILESVKEGQYGNQYFLRLTIPHLITLYDTEKKKPMDEPTQVDKGKLVGTPSHAVLIGMLDQVPIGSRVKIKVTGIQPTKKKGFSDTNIYTVGVWKE